ncbi:MAG: GNAT family N-acetyltransferase [Chloroflexota bacterium]
MPIVPADLTYAREVANLFAHGKNSYGIQHPVEPSSLISSQTSVIGLENGKVWGFLSIDYNDIRLASSEQAAQSVVMDPICRRIYLTHVALARGRSPYEDVAELLSGAAAQILPNQSQLKPTSNKMNSLLIWYGDQRWLIAPLEKAGLTITERIEFFVLARLQRRTLPPINFPKPDIRLRLAQQDDLDRLAQIDASVFTPIWHMALEQLKEVWTTHRIFVAEVDEELAGYSAIAFTADHEQAHLARLAVDQRFQGMGLGRYLLFDVLYSAQRQGAMAITLNTQTDNLPARQLYRSVGFRRTGNILPVMTQWRSSDG